MTLSPKHLSFDEMWGLYKNIKEFLPEQDKEFLIDEVLEILKKINKDSFLSVLFAIYGNDFHRRSTPAEYGLLLIKGIKKNNLFGFIEFIKRLEK